VALRECGNTSCDTTSVSHSTSAALMPYRRGIKRYNSHVTCQACDTLSVLQGKMRHSGRIANDSATHIECHNTGCDTTGV